jgi:ribonuclease HI/uncharacterized phage-like protein YoqJ
MEILAAAEAVRSISGPLVIVSDSTYVVNCFNDGWWRGWHARDWKNKAKKPVANRDLWEPFIDLVNERGDVTFEWVKGHSGDPMNDLVDALAVEAAAAGEGRSGDAPPTDVADPREAKRRKRPQPAVHTAKTGSDQAGVAERDSRLPSGQLLTVLGHRPPEMGGYDSPALDVVRGQLREIIEAKVELHDGALSVVSGLRLGAEMLGAEAAVQAGASLVAVLPFPDPDAKWPAASRKRFATLVDAAATTLTLETKVPSSTQLVAGSLRRRDSWLMRNVDEAILVWNGDALLRKLHSDLERRLGDDVWVLEPPSA